MRMLPSGRFSRSKAKRNESPALSWREKSICHWKTRSSRATTWSRSAGGTDASASRLTTAVQRLLRISPATRSVSVVVTTVTVDERQPSCARSR